MIATTLLDGRNDKMVHRNIIRWCPGPNRTTAENAMK
jgi:hypothetical protein